MRFLGKVLVLVVVVIGLCAVATVIAIRFLPETDLIRDSLQRSLSDYTGHTVSIGGLKTSLSFPGLFRLTIEEMSVTSRGGVKLLSAQRVDLAPSLASLWEKKVLVRSIYIQGLKAVVRRSAGGKLEDFLSLETVSSRGRPPSLERSREGSGAAERTGTSLETRSIREIETGVKWSIDSVRLANAQIDWIDAEVSSGRETRISVKKINGFLDRKEPGNVLAVRCTGELAGMKDRESPVTVVGSLWASEDFSALVGVNLDLQATSVDLNTFREYAPPELRLGETFDHADLQSRIAWQKDRSPRVSVKTQVKSSAIQAALLDLAGEVTLYEDVSGIREIHGTAQSDMVPLPFLTSYLPVDFLLNARQGWAKVNLKGEWSSPESWRCSGAVAIEHAVPAGPLQVVADAVRVQIVAELTPRNLTIENLEISGTTKLASMAGAVSNPLSTSRDLDLKGELIIRAEWLKGFGVQLPRDVNLSGPVPLRGKARGTMDDLSLDLTGDLSGTVIQWLPYLEKSQGTGGTISLKGNVVARPKPSLNSNVSQAHVRVRMTDAGVRLVPAGPQLTGCAVNFDSKVFFTAKKADLKDAALTVRHGTEGNLLAAKADITDLRTGAAKIHGEAGLTVGKTVLALSGFTTGTGINMSGSTLLTVRFKGLESSLDWSVGLPLKAVEIAYGKVFRKSAGVAGDLKASGNWTRDELTLGLGKLTLPGIVVTGQGTLRDKTGKFPGLTLVAKNARLEELSTLVSGLRDQGLSGPADITMRLRASQNALATEATARLIEADYRPKNAGWSFEDITGTVETDGAVLEVPELQGKLKGVVEGPITLKGKLDNVKSVETLNGRFAVRVGKGRFNPGQLRDLIRQANILLGTLFDPQHAGDRSSPLEMDGATGTFHIRAGSARTEDFKLKGPDLGLGAIGAIDLKTISLDCLVGIKTFTVVPSVVGTIPQVRRLVKEHEGLLKAFGLDKELKRLGIDGSEPAPENSDRRTITKTPVTVILKLQGPASSPAAAPILEATLDKTTAARLKSLIE